MKRMRYVAVAGMLCASGALAACGSDDGGSGGGDGGEDAGKIGVILPDTTSSPRWESADRPALEAAFEEAGVDYDIQNAQDEASRMSTIADQMINEGVTVLAIVNLDSESGAAIQKKAEEAGVQTIDYDRLTLGGSADYYVSYDNNVVGELQGKGLAECLGDEPANIVYLNGSPDDNNATLFAEGAHEVLDPMEQYTVVAEQAVPKWDPAQAQTIFEQMYTANNGEIDGVLAANDTLGNSAIAVLRQNGVAGKVPVTGQDATVQGLQNILDGSQCMTVYKSAKAEAGALAEVAIALNNGEEPETTGTLTDSVGGREVASILLDPESITKENVGVPVEDGAVSAEELCTGDYAALCQEAGIS